MKGRYCITKLNYWFLEESYKTFNKKITSNNPVKKAFLLFICIKLEWCEPILRINL